ncbi:putative secreted protein (Por secretion system target) [Mariniflexile fucanivorans]|uniref:Putative secreted protein (Por secretion system target) n=1 Tax=Mariniflexile fucanivorans TaxID=264023 RepID=A0A4R1R8W0_9FLAO|nr:T9SS type A sorting domain-containing protein [Mariniflexile fucanivorans]TCL62114.1 putative secreted protein (Por secretion system target) [Mariniflexile fucanivorans]
MKQFILCVLFGASTLVQAQDKIKFEYDLAGNQIQRELCINCTSAKSSKKSNKEIASIEEPELQKFSDEDTFSYYPNPVKEELYLQWNSTDESRVVAVHVFDLSGRLLKTVPNLKSQNHQNIAFESYPSGIYEVVLVYENQNKKTIKIIKK